MDLRLAVCGAFVIAVVLTASSCHPGQTLLGEPLPTASATLHWATIDLQRGGYCWNSGGQGVCVDMASTDQLLNTGFLKPYRTAGGFDVKITFHSAAQPTSFNVQLIHSPDGQLMAVDETGPQMFPLQVSPPAITGVYVYGVNARWAEGDVSFYLTIQLVPGVA